MKNLFMIMCHKNPKQVIRLAERLISAESDVVLHADSNMPKDEYSVLKNYALGKSNVYLTDERIHGVLDDRSLVDIVFLMIKCVKSKGLSYGYYCLLSGQDYPVKSVDYINRELKASYPTPYIDCTPYDRNNWVYHKFSGNKSYYLLNKKIERKFPKNGTLPRRILKSFALLYKKASILAHRTHYHQLTKNGVELFGGSAWWILSDVIIDYIYGEYSGSAPVVASLLETSTPEETFFQIMAMRSPLKDKIQLNPKDMVLQNCKTYAYFFDDNKPFVGHPYIFTDAEFDKLKNTDFWFARKFDITVNEKILDLLDGAST